MKTIYIYGTGSKALRYLPALAAHFKILGFLDSAPERQGEHLLGFEIFHCANLPSHKYDEIVIASSFSEAITDTLQTYNLRGVLLESLPAVMAFLTDYEALTRHYDLQAQPALPQVALECEHIEQASLLTNRRELLKRLPKGGHAAELGVANGDFTEEILKLSQPKKLHLVDIWQSERYNERLYENVKQKFSKELAQEQVIIHRKLSTEAATEFPDHYFDWVYIDTTHCYQVTKSELHLYAKKLKSGGLLLGHDYTMGNWDTRFRYGVMEAVHEFCAQFGWKIKYLTMDLAEGQSFALEKIQH